MKKVTAEVKFEYDFTESLAFINKERKKDGEEPMTDEEIQSWIEWELVDFDFRQTVGELPCKVMISEVEETTEKTTG